jgi:hypothetical protein
MNLYQKTSYRFWSWQAYKGSYWHAARCHIADCLYGVCFRFSEDELRRFHMAANGDFSSLLSSVKKTIRWRETFHILTLQELEKWSHLVFWHGFDTTLRPCLVIRLGLACSSIAPRDRPRFGQAVGNFLNLFCLPIYSTSNFLIIVHQLEHEQWISCLHFFCCHAVC